MREAIHAASLVDLWAHGAVTESSQEGQGGAANDSRAEAEEATERGIRVAEAIERSASDFYRKLLETAEIFEKQFT